MEEPATPKAVPSRNPPHQQEPTLSLPRTWTGLSAFHDSPLTHYHVPPLSDNWLRQDSHSIQPNRVGILLNHYRLSARHSVEPVCCHWQNEDYLFLHQERDSAD